MCSLWFQGLDLAAQVVVLALVLGLSLRVSATLSDRDRP
jgi:hypothetical protein